MSQTDDILARLLENNGAGFARNDLVNPVQFGSQNNNNNGNGNLSQDGKNRNILDPPEGSGENARRVKGIRRIPPPIPLDAPTQPRTYITPSSTSRKTTTAAVERQLERYYQNGSKHKDGDLADLSIDDESESPEPQTSIVGSGGGGGGNGNGNSSVSDLPPSLLSTIELKRRQNTLAARRSRARKAQHLKDLEGEVVRLEKDRDDWKDRAERLEEEVRRLGGVVGLPPMRIGNDDM